MHHERCLVDEDCSAEVFIAVKDSPGLAIFDMMKKQLWAMPWFPHHHSLSPESSEGKAITQHRERRESKLTADTLDGMALPERILC